MLSQISWHSLHMLPLVIALAVALVVAVLWLYPSQVRHVAWPWRLLLPGLRAAGLLVLTASLLQPAALRLRRAEERAAVLVLVDRSRSMSVTDVGREPAYLVALADGLGRLPAGARAGETADLATALDRLRALLADVVSASNDLETAQAFGRGIEAARRRLAEARASFAAAADALAARAESVPAEGELRPRLAALKDVPAAGAGREAWSAEARARVGAAALAAAAFQREADRKLYEANAEVKAACDELAKLSRWSLAEQALLRTGTGVVARALTTMPVVAYAVSDTVSPVALAREAEVKATLPTEPTAPASNVAGAVPAALAMVGSRPIRAVVLLSDGRQVGGDAAVVSGLAPAGVPVFAVSVAPPGPAHDLGIGRDVSIPGSAFIGETVTVRASITSAGLPPGATDVQLRVGEAVQTQRVTLTPGQAAPAEFSIRLEQGGPQKIVLSLPATPGEITAENNQVERWVKVLPERMRVAAFAGTAGRDYQFLRNALARTRWVQLESGVLDPVQPALPLAPAQILQQDVLILSDVAVSALSDVQWDAVNELVRARGGSLFLLAGPFNLPSTYTPEAIVASGLLPYDAKNFAPAWREWPGGEAAFRLVPSPRAVRGQLDALRLGDGPGDLRRWQSLPGAFRYLPIPELNAKLSTQALLVEADSRMPVLTESRPGAGRVFFLGADETWRWRLKAGERDFDRFWLQLVRYAADEPYAAERGLLALDVTPIAPAPGQAVAVRARILHAEPQTYRIEVVRDGKAVQVQPLAPAGTAGSGKYTATVSGLPEGDYLVRLTDPGLPATTMPAPAATPVLMTTPAPTTAPAAATTMPATATMPAPSTTPALPTALATTATPVPTTTPAPATVPSPTTVPAPATTIDTPLHVVASVEAEMADVSGDEGLLRRLAESSGGEYLTLDRLGELQSLLEATVDNRSRFSEVALWDNPFLFLFVVACFGAEWALRKRFGLA